MSLAVVMEAKSHLRVTANGLMERQTSRDWVIRFNDEELEGLTDHMSPGSKPKLNDE